MKRLSGLKLLFLLTSVILTSCGTNPGAPAPEPDREIFVVMRDDFTYDPPSIEVTTGEIISFQVANKGKLRHEFLIGSRQQHEEHEKEMAAGNEHGAHESELEGVSVDAGDEESFTYIVPKSGDLLFGCHEPGHYEKGMRGSIQYRS